MFYIFFMVFVRDWLRKVIVDADPRDIEVLIVFNVDAVLYDMGVEWLVLLLV